MTDTDTYRTHQKLVIVTGLSGAGISTALKALEDVGYEVFDNFPLTLIAPLLQDTQKAQKPVAIGIDTRTRAFSPETIQRAAADHDAALLFLNCSDEALQKRFSETRRLHPLATDRPVIDGIIQERHWLAPLMDAADSLINTTDMTVHDLKRAVQQEFNLAPDESVMTVTLMSFGFKYGVPRQVDSVFDVRFLDNPHWHDDLRPLTGRDPAVQNLIKGDRDFAHYCRIIEDYLRLTLPRYAHEGKRYMTIAFGCTGGRHRSVFLAEHFKPVIEDLGFRSALRHHELEKSK